MPDRSFRWEVPYARTPGRSYLLPVVQVYLTFSQRTGPYVGLVDSGAQRSAFPASIARAAGVDVDSLPIVRVSGVSGVSRARMCPTDMEIFGRRIATEILIIETGIVLLGRNDVFRAFQFGFDERANLLLVEPY